jgi:hypothetical protein
MIAASSNTTRETAAKETPSTTIATFIPSRLEPFVFAGMGGGVSIPTAYRVSFRLSISWV